MSKSTWSKGRLSVRLSHVCETDCNRFLLDKESTGCTDRCNRTKIPEHANSARAPAWEAEVLLHHESLTARQVDRSSTRRAVCSNPARADPCGGRQVNWRPYRDP